MGWRSLSIYQRVVLVIVLCLLGLALVAVALRPKPGQLVSYAYGVESSVFAYDTKRGGPLAISVKLDTGAQVTINLPDGVRNQPGARVKLGIYTVSGGGPQERMLKFETYEPAAP